MTRSCQVKRWMRSTGGSWRRTAWVLVASAMATSVLDLRFFRAVAQVMERDADCAEDHAEAAYPLQRPFPETNHYVDGGVLGQAAVLFGVVDVVKNIDDVGPAN